MSELEHVGGGFSSRRQLQVWWGFDPDGPPDLPIVYVALPPAGQFAGVVFGMSAAEAVDFAELVADVARKALEDAPR